MQSSTLRSALFWILVAAALLWLPACQPTGGENTAPDKAAIESELRSILDEQDDAWSAGNIDAFMESYWKSPELRFASRGKVSRGWEATKEGYYTRYPNPDIMGRLITDNYEVDVLSSEAAIVHGAWRLERDGEPASGLYTLVFKKIDGQWVITSDTTTSAN